ncbi:MAG TPA: Gfo/Idh/MocA family oxidoreductase [Candidatus Binatia bacterium]|jgi:predicted dehydrogenase|nr:Gfo/Idh/MocA family oxidoreductase [Candidatus Binatia bacterium]
MKRIGAQPSNTNPDHNRARRLSRRQFMVTSGAAAGAFALVPRHVLGGPGFVAPSEKITLACIGFGTQAIREIGGILARPEVQIVAVCDVEKDGVNYLEWSKNDLRNTMRQLLNNPTWREGIDHVPGGRDVGKEVVETYYAKQRSKEQFKGCATYEDFRELLEKEKDVTAVKVMTPDHTHATISIAALKKGMNVIVHKPLANRLLEARAVVDNARTRKIATHFMPASEGANQKEAIEMVKHGAIGTLREIHNWSYRPVWPQFATVPTDTPPVPAGFDWNLWLGPSLERPYHPNYTHTNFRGWYEFGGGSIADMGHYSLWPIFQLLELDSPVSVESTPSHVATVSDQICRRIHNDYSFPVACTVRMRFAPKGQRPGLDIFWYDGGIKPPVPDELMAENKELAEEGMLFVGDKGKILGGFRCENPQLIPEAKMRAYRAENHQVEPAARTPGARGRRDGDPSGRDAAWVTAFKGGPASYGDFTLAGPISDAFNLASISLRLGGRRLLWDSANAKITNVPEANKFLTREYRPGWEI